MASYRLLFKNSVAKDLRALPKRDVKSILKRIEALSENPRDPGCKKLAAGDCYRVRQGRYRIIYEIRDDTLLIYVIKAAHRSSVYAKK